MIGAIIEVIEGHLDEEKGERFECEQFEVNLILG